MKKYFVLYHASKSALKKMNDSSPEEMEKGMEPWMAWAEKLGSKLLDFGTPLGGGQKLTKAKAIPSKKNVVGYSILQAKNMDEAKDLLRGHPHLDWADGCQIEVHESLPTPN